MTVMPQVAMALPKHLAGCIHAPRFTKHVPPTSADLPMTRSKQLELFEPSKIDVVPARRPEGRGVSLSAVGLFTGIGGFEIGLEAAGHRTNMFCEIDPVASAVLAVSEMLASRDVLQVVKTQKEELRDGMVLGHRGPCGVDCSGVGVWDSRCRVLWLW